MEWIWWPAGGLWLVAVPVLPSPADPHWLVAWRGVIPPQGAVCMPGELCLYDSALSSGLFGKRLADTEGEGQIFKAHSAHNWSQISGGALLPFKHLKKVTGLFLPAALVAGNKSCYRLTPALDK